MGSGREEGGGGGGGLKDVETDGRRKMLRKCLDRCSVPTAVDKTVGSACIVQITRQKDGRTWRTRYLVGWMLGCHREEQVVRITVPRITSHFEPCVDYGAYQETILLSHPPFPAPAQETNKRKRKV